MHFGRNCQGHVWLLSGTGEGPRFAKALIARDWRVTVSVVSFEASFAYEDLCLEEIKIGPLKGVSEITQVLKESRVDNEGFDWVIDATHPFAELISSGLRKACIASSQPLLRFERPYERTGEANLIKEFKDLASLDLHGQRILMAIGTRYLNEAVISARDAGAIVFARVLPTPENFKKALSSDIPSSHLALLRPLSSEKNAELEAALCRQWSITGVVCRQSGGVIERRWKYICSKYKLDLWLLSRPDYSNDVEVIYSFEEFFARTSSRNYPI
tara:strand:- start:381 stop:1196 length:816 start_codon:yes stop_codon:yes gene_type:complete